MSEYYAPCLESVGLVPVLEERVDVPAATTVNLFANAPEGTAAVLFTAPSTGITLSFTFLGADPSNAGHNLCGNYFTGKAQGFLQMEAKHLRRIQVRHDGATTQPFWITYFAYRAEARGSWQ